MYLQRIACLTYVFLRSTLKLEADVAALRAAFPSGLCLQNFPPRAMIRISHMDRIYSCLLMEISSQRVNGMGAQQISGSGLTLPWEETIIKTSLGTIFVAAGPNRILKCQRGFWTVAGTMPTTASSVLSGWHSGDAGNGKHRSHLVQMGSSIYRFHDPRTCRQMTPAQTGGYGAVLTAYQAPPG